jgi:hypothetical protein
LSKDLSDDFNVVSGEQMIESASLVATPMRTSPKSKAIRRPRCIIYPIRDCEIAAIASNDLVASVPPP